MSQIILDEKVFQDFCRHASSNINVLDLVYTVHRFCTDFDINKDHPIRLLTRDASIFELLLNFEYHDFLQKFVANLRILPSCHDVYLSELGKETFELFVLGFEKFAVNTTVQITEQCFDVHVPALISDLIMPIVGRVHEEILLGLKQFSDFIKAADNRPDGGFLHAKAPTPESQFIQMWVASKLKVPANPSCNIVVVI